MEMERTGFESSGAGILVEPRKGGNGGNDCPREEAKESYNTQNKLSCGDNDVVVAMYRFVYEGILV
jgi:hypothetical protein